MGAGGGRGRPLAGLPRHGLRQGRCVAGGGEGVGDAVRGGAVLGRDVLPRRLDLREQVLQSAVRRQSGVQAQARGRRPPGPGDPQPADRGLAHGELPVDLGPGQLPRPAPGALRGERGRILRALCGRGAARHQRRPALVAGAEPSAADAEHRHSGRGGEQPAGRHHAHHSPLHALHGLLGRAGAAVVGGLSRRGVLGGLLLLGGGRIARLLRGGLVLRGRRLGRGGGGRVLGGVVPLRRAHPVGGCGRCRLEAHPAVLGAEPHLGPGVRVAGGHGPFVPVLLAGGEADGHPGGVPLRDHHQREGRGELLAVAHPVLEEGLQRVLARR